MHPSFLHFTAVKATEPRITAFYLQVRQKRRIHTRKLVQKTTCQI